MKALSLYFVVILTLGLSVVNLSHAQAAEPFLITPVGSLDNGCIDTAPIGDGFGWNGVCSCRVGSPYVGFGRTLGLAGDNLVVGAMEAPQSCVESGSTSVYHLADSSLPVKTQEFVSGSSDHSFRSTVDVRYRNGHIIATNSDTLAIAVDDGIAIFKENSGVWEEHALVVFENNLRHGSALLAQFIGNHLLLAGYDRVSVYDADTFVQVQSISIDSNQIWQLKPYQDGFIINYRGSTGAGASHLALYSLQNGLYTRGQSFNIFEEGLFNNVFFDLEDDLLVIGEQLGSNLDIDSLTQINKTYRKDVSGQWVEIGVPLLSGRLSILTILQGQLILEDKNNLLFYVFDEQAGWVLDQTMPIGTEDEVKFIWIRHKSKKGLIVTAFNTESPTRSVIIAVVERDTDDVWKKVVSYEHDHTRARPVVAEGWLPDVTSDFVIASLLTEDRAFIGTNASGVLVFDLTGGGNQTDVSIAASCNYDDATRNGGWGWDALNNTSCPPVVSGCDYSNADLHNGWGWNAVTRESCAPQAELPVCIDTGIIGDGWGWDGADSCRL